DGPLEFLKNFEKKIAYIEFSPNGNFLYIGSGGFYLGGYTNLTYLGQIDLTASPLELRLQIQITDAYDDVEGYGYTFSNASDASYLAWHGISDIQSSYDGNLYFTKLNSNTLFVIPDPDSYMPQMLVPGTVDLSTQAEPNISVNGDVLLLPDQIDGYEYITGEHCLCGEVIEESLTYACAPQGSYSYSFSLQNVSPEFTVTSVALLNVEPAGIDIQAVLPNGGTTSPFWNLNSSAPFNLPPMQPNGGTTGPLEALITPGSPITEPTDVCFEVVYYNSTYECCRYEHCITLEPIDPCQYVSVSQAGELETEDCCYDLALTNEYCPDFFTGIIIESITDGVVFTGEDGGNTWTTTVENGGKQIHWQPTSGAIPMGETGDMHFCLEGIHSTAQMPQEVLIHWLAIDPDSGEEEIICTQKELFNCQPCMSFTIDDDILCNPDGTFTVGFTVTNMADGHTAEYLILESNTANLLFDPALQWLDGLEPGESYDGSFTVYDFNNTPLAPGTEISFKAMLDDGEGWCCHFDGLTFEVPDCGQGGGCACGTQEEFSAAVNAGFTADVDCNNGQINVMANNLGPCDDVEFALFLPSQVFVESSAGAGDETVTLPKPVDGPYLIVMSVLRYDEAGNLCYESAMSQEIYVLCNPCECGTMGEFVNDVNAGFTFNEICFDGLFVLDANALDPCDQVIWNVYGPDGTLVASQDLFGQQPAYFSVPPDGVYTVEMAVTRIDNSGDPCFPNRTFEDDIVINCLPPQSSSLAAVISTARPDAQPNSGMGGSRDLTRSGRPQASTGYINGDAGEARLVNEPGSAPHQPLLLYPNPAASQVNVIVTEAGFYQIQAFDRYGRAVKQWQRQLDAHEKLNLNVQELPAGLYLLQLQDERGKVESGKFVKM
ncbi:MAG: T9SS type A sorting domain-containing protein, partial [Lewinellaceae bacterium]|nr:T9SS type A sorting domain-containing protein [Lewinellaceae bacterium]